MNSRVCAWCRKPIPPGKRRDAQTCSKPCRQARHRFRVGAAGATADRPIRVAYADPPYPGLARKYYGSEEVDHGELIGRLVADFPDGAALSTSSRALRRVLPLCPEDALVNPWVRHSRGHRAKGRINVWEPLIIWGGRQHSPVAEDLRDALVWGGRQHTHPDALVGMKPAAFAEWMFRLLGLEVGDEFIDLYPGSGAITRAWELYTSCGAAGDTSLPSRLEESQGRLGSGAEMSRRARRDASCRDAEDGSRPGRRDASAPTADDPSGSSPRDASSEYFCDSSAPFQLERGPRGQRASPEASDDASFPPASATARRGGET